MTDNLPVSKHPPQLPQVYFPTQPISGFDDFGGQFRTTRSYNDPVPGQSHDGRTEDPGLPYAHDVRKGMLLDRPTMRGALPPASSGAKQHSAPDVRPVSNGGTSVHEAGSRIRTNNTSNPKSSEVGYAESHIRHISYKAELVNTSHDEVPLVNHCKNVATRDFAYIPRIVQTSATPAISGLTSKGPDRLVPAAIHRGGEHVIVPSWRHVRPHVVTTKPTLQHTASQQLPDSYELRQVRAIYSPEALVSSLDGLYQNSSAGRADPILSMQGSHKPHSYVASQAHKSHAPATREVLKRDNNQDSHRTNPQFVDHRAVRPDHSLLGWLQAIFGSLVVANCWGFNLSYGVFEAYYKMTLLSQHSRSSIAWIGSAQLSLIFLSSVVVGRIYDRGIVRPFFHGGSIGIIAGMLGTSWCKSWAQLFWVQGILLGLSMGSVFCSGILVLLEYFEHRLGIAIALSAVGGSIGGIIYTLMAQRLFFTVGFAWTMRYMSFVALATLIPSNLLHRPRYPNQLGTNPRPSSDWKFMRNPAFLSMILGMFFSFWSLYFGYYYIVLYGHNVLHLSSSTSVNLLLTMLATNLPGRFLPAVLSDICMGPLNTLIPFCFLCSATLLLWIGVSTTTGLFVVAAFYGLVSGGPQALFSPVLATFLERTEHDGVDPNKGLKSAILFATIGFACATGTPLGGALIDRGSNDAPRGMPYLYGQLFAGVTMAAAGVCFLTSRYLRVGWKVVRT